MATKTPKRKPTKVNPEELVNKLRKTIQGLKTNIAIYENDMQRAVQSLKDQYGIETIEEGIQMVESLDAELQEKEKDLDSIAAKIEVALRNYSG